MPWLLAYVLTIALVNIGFAHVPLIDLGALGMWPPMSLAVGSVFVLRDFSQRQVGHFVIVGIIIGIAISYFLASPFVAVASAVAFASSEAADWLIYTWANGSFKRRVVLSSIVGTPIDSAVFLLMIGHFSWAAMLTMIASKMVAATLVLYLKDEQVNEVVK